MNTKLTPLYDWHKSHKANMADFGGYNMPLWYPSGIKNEHLAVITKAGMFDTSHMSVIIGKGSDIFHVLQKCFTRDLNKCIGEKKLPITLHRCVYGAFLNKKGETIDDAIIYKLKDNNYMIVVNSGMGNKITEHILANSQAYNIELEDLTDKLGKIDIQGPCSGKIMSKVVKDYEKVFKNMPYFSFKGHFDSSSDILLTDKTQILLSRTGYTGEFGFEIFSMKDHIVKIWEMIYKAGKDFGLIPCGLASRDSLRAGAMLPLSHQDIGKWKFINNPWSFALPYNESKTDFTKDFIGKDALINIKNPEYTYAFAGYNLRKVSDPADVYTLDGNKIGKALTCVTDMAIDRYDNKILSITSPDLPKNSVPKGLSCGFVKVKEKLVPGDIVEIADKKRRIKATIVQDIRTQRTARCLFKDML